jgi:uncharacterized protein DUF4177
MKIRSKLTLVVAIVAVLFLVGWTGRADQPSKTDWEYKAIVIWHNPDVMQPSMKELNDLGDDGWELVTTIPSEVTHGNSHQSRLTCYFKRPR